MKLNERLDSDGLRTHCPYCGKRLQRRKDWKTETCRKCKKKISYNPILDLPYSDTNVPIEQSKREIQERLEDMELSQIFWGTEYKDDIYRANVLQAKFKDGTGFKLALPFVESYNDNLEKQMMRILYHYIKAISILYKLGILEKAEMLLGLLQVGDTNLGKVVNTEQMLKARDNAFRLLQGE